MLHLDKPERDNLSQACVIIHYTEHGTSDLYQQPADAGQFGNIGQFTLYLLFHLVFGS